MYDEPLSQNDLSPTAMEQLDQRLIRALETVPEPHIPVDFAARIASQLPARRPLSLTPHPLRPERDADRHHGHSGSLAGFGAAHLRATSPSGSWSHFFLTQFIALTVWLSIWRHRLR